MRQQMEQPVGPVATGRKRARQTAEKAKGGVEGSVGAMGSGLRQSQPVARKQPGRYPARSNAGQTTQWWMSS